MQIRNTIADSLKSFAAMGNCFQKGNSSKRIELLGFELSRIP